MKIWTNGTFDIIHPGHIELLKYAKSFGTELHVGIDYDDRVTKLKGNNRPIFDWYDRSYLIESIKYVDEVYGFGTDKELEDLILFVKPDIIVVGSDYINKKVIGSNLVKEVIYFNRIEEYSTTEVIENIINKMEKNNG